jgi:hypothetical protein
MRTPAFVKRAGSTAVGTYAAYVLYGLRHPEMLTPGTTAQQAEERLPGDELVEHPDWCTTFATTIAATPDEVWPWIVQLGYGRAGWYTWYPLDNGGVASADRVVPELQELEPGDVIPDGPRAAEGFGVWRVHGLDRPHAMILLSRRNPFTGREIEPGDTSHEPYMDCSWAFVLDPVGPRETELLVRVRVGLRRMDHKKLLARLSRLLFGLGDNVMERSMLEGIKTRAERRPS